MEQFASLVPLVVIFPLVGLLINLFFGKYLGEKTVGFIASLAAGLAFCVAVLMTIASTSSGFPAVVVNAPLISNWMVIPSAGINVLWQFRVDTLSLTMMLVVTGIGTLIHIYAIGYMHGDSRFPRFFVYLNLFLMFMLILVTGNNFLITFIGWEGVGLCSFLLIGFWFDKTRGEGWKNSNAARKAFIVNRIGDFGFLIAIFMIFWTFGTLDYYKQGEVIPQTEGEVTATAVQPTAGQQATTPAQNTTAASTDKGVFGLAEQYIKENRTIPIGPYSLPISTDITLITLFMLLGVTGKSAQIPLFIWLPDAMAGPTPVSALMHAATMVTAGIFLITRSNVLYHNAPLSSTIVALIGATTALMAGFIAAGQWDIKKVLAYSTVSQLGFMVTAIGLGAYTAGMFHLVTHAFFKALLFLGAGSVIHGVEHGHHIAEHGHGDHAEAHADAHADPHAETHGEHTPESEEPVFDAQDMRNMGGLRKRMPITFWTYLIGTLALSGIFPLAGFWSKDEILGKAFSVGFDDGRLVGYITFAFLLVAAGFTAFYMWRQICMVFLGTPRTAAAENAPESTPLMTWPLIGLAILSVIGGALNFPNVRYLRDIGAEKLTEWLKQSVTYATALPFNLPLAIVALLIALGAIFVANLIYGARPVTAKGRDPLQARPETRPLFNLANAKLYWDETYWRFFGGPYVSLSKWLADRLDWAFWHDYVHNTVIAGGFNGMAALLSQPVDKGAIDNGFMGIGRAVEWVSSRLRRIETGYVRTYAFSVLFGVLMVLFLILYEIYKAAPGR